MFMIKSKIEKYTIAMSSDYEEVLEKLLVLADENTVSLVRKYTNNIKKTI